MTQVYKDMDESDIKTIDDVINAVQNAEHGTTMRIAITKGFKLISDMVVDDTSKQSDVKDSIEKLSDLVIKTNDDLTARIDRIILGTDDDSIRLVVENILKEKGVIE